MTVKILTSYCKLCWVDRWLFVLAFGMGTMASIMAAQVPKAFTEITLAIPMQQPYVEMLKVFAMYHVLTCFFAALRGHLFTFLINNISYRVHDMAMMSVVAQPIATFEMQDDLGDTLTHRLDTYAHQLALNGNVVVRTLVNMSFVLGFMIQKSLGLTLITGALIAARLWMFKRYEKRYHALWESINKRKEEMHRFVREYVHHIMTVRLFDRDAWTVAEVTRMRQGMVEAATGDAFGYGLFVFLSQMLDKAVVIATLAVSAWTTSSTHVLYFLNYQGELLDNVNALLEVYRSTVATREAYQKVDGVLALAPPSPLPAAVAACAPPSCWDIVFDQVWFAYPKRPDTVVLRDVCMCIPQGTTCAVVGTSGSGKSTLFKLLAGVYTPQRGCLYLGDRPLYAYDRKELFKHMAFVPQEPILFNRTIRDNILFGGAGVDEGEDEVEDACRCVGLHDFITALPDGYDTLCGSGSLQSFSGGQKQRLAIARALMRRPQCRLLLLDEPTSALDEDTAGLVTRMFQARYFDNPFITALVIAHHASLTAMCQRVIRVSADGHVRTTSVQSHPILSP